MISILVGDNRKTLKTLPEKSVQCVVTSPPYYGLRDYGTAKWMGGKKGCDHKPTVDTAKAIRKSGLTQKQALTAKGVVAKKSNIYMGNAASAHYKNVCAKCGAKRVDHQIGLEPTVQGYIDSLVEVSREIRRVLRDDGVYWLNLGDSYVSIGASDGNIPQERSNSGLTPEKKNKRYSVQDTLRGGKKTEMYLPEFGPHRQPQEGFKHKDLMGIPWRVALALHADGWHLRMDVIWHKPQPMPESVEDRPTKSHEYIFMLTKKPRYFYDGFAVREPSVDSWNSKKSFGTYRPKADDMSAVDMSKMRTQFAHNTHHDNQQKMGRNKRSVWTIQTPNYAEAHFATFPEELVEICIKAGASERGCCASCGTPWVRAVEKGTSKSGLAGTYELRTAGWAQDCKCKTKDEPVPCMILDPFGGAGTVGLVAARLKHDATLCELNDKYAAMAAKRIKGNMGFFGEVRMVHDGG